MKVVLRFSIVAIGCVIACVFCVSAKEGGYAKKKYSGTFYEEAALISVPYMNKHEICGVAEDTTKSGGYLIEISEKIENPLFESAKDNEVFLYIWFAELPEPGEKTYIGSDENVRVCYHEKGDLLMFLTSEAIGSIRFDEVKSGKSVSGEMDLKLVNPVHNMSNGDYQYMGGSFKLKWRGV